MSFRENLLKKIQIKQLGKKVLASMGSVDSGKRTDIDALRELLDMSPYRHQRVRDLELYMLPADGDMDTIIVLGNDLPMYKSSQDDIVMRRSPILKEMISIRNAIKILNDSDVLISKGPETLATIEKSCLAALDLHFDKTDLDAIANDGIASLENANQDGVIEGLILLAELLGFEPAPKKLAQDHFYIVGKRHRSSGRVVRFGPAVLYGKIHNQLKFFDGDISLSDPEKIDHFHMIVAGTKQASLEGAPVFQQLNQSVLNLHEAAGR